MKLNTKTALICVGVFVVPLGFYFSFSKVIHPFLTRMDSVPPTLSNALLFSLVIFMTVCPIVPFRGLAMMGCAFVFKWYSLCITYPASVISTWFWFRCLRWLSVRYQLNFDSLLKRFSPRWFLRFKALANALENQSAQTTTLLMLANVPLNLLVAFLATTRVPFRAIIIGSLISNLKLIRDIWEPPTRLAKEMAAKGLPNEEFITIQHGETRLFKHFGTSSTPSSPSATSSS